MKKITFIILFIGFGLISLHAQDKANNRGVQTVLDFLTIPMDSRSSGMGDMGVGTSVDSYSHQHNAAKYIFGSNKKGVSLSYSPWLRDLVKDMNLASISGYYVIDTLQSVSGSFRFFSMGNMDYFDPNAAFTGTSSPYQLSADAAYSRKLSQYFSAAIGFRFALADLYSSISGYKSGWGVAADLNVYFQKGISLGSLPSKITAGASLSNIGTKVSFQKNGSNYFMPMNFKLGAGLTMNLNADNSLMFGGELARSLVPTKESKLDDSSIEGMFSSISEGNFRSIIWSLGAEYGFRNMLFGRMGYRHENQIIGDRKYLTFGAGIAYRAVQFDFSYLVATGIKNNAMGNTLRISMSVNW